MKQFAQGWVAVVIMGVVLAQIAFAQVPTIASVSPGSGKMGRTVIIAGTNFDATPANNRVYFGGAYAPVLSATTTSLRVNAPPQASFRPVTVTNLTTNRTAYSVMPFGVTFNPSAGISAGSFGGRIDRILKTGPEATAIADFDLDGKPDVATICYNANILAVLPNTSVPGLMSFSDAIIDTTGVAPNEIAVGDIDGDGLIDVVVSNFDTTNAPATISVLRNTSTFGVISFADSVNFRVGRSPSGIAVADLDGDGRPDIVVANQTDGTLSVLRNTTVGAAISFATPPLLLSPGGVTHTVAIGDLNGDLKPDLAVTNPDSREVTIFKNVSSSGNIAFGSDTVRVSFFRGTVPDSLAAPLFVAMGDIDGDGRLDLAVTDTATVAPNVYVLRNISSGTSDYSFSSPAIFRRGVGIGAVTIADLNGDGRPDLLCGNSIDNTVSILRNTGSPGSITSGSFAARVDFPVTDYPIRVAVGDLDGDGHPDFAVPGFTSGAVTIMRNLIPDGYVRANLKTILQGPYTSAGDSMANALNTGGALSSHFGAGVFPPATVDSVNIEVRDNSSPGSATFRRFVPAWITKNGTLRSVTDTSKSYVDIDTVAPGSYFVIVRHRNHLAIMSRATVALDVNGALYDFTTSQTKAFGTSAMIQVGTKFCMYSGDGNASGIITAQDANVVFGSLNQAGYFIGDGNLSGIVTASDANIVFTNLNAATKVP